MQRNQGWAPFFGPLEVLRPSRRFKRTNIISAICKGAIIAPTLYDWTTTGDWFELWFEKVCLLITDQAIIIMDNAWFHQKKVQSNCLGFWA